MSNSGRKKPRLVADRRHPKPKRKPAAAVKKPVTRRKKAAPKRKKRAGSKRKRNPILAFFARIFGRLLRLIWKITWRVTAVASAVIALWVGYVYTTLPELSAFLDGRSRGSVTLLDHKGEVFASR